MKKSPQGNAQLLRGRIRNLHKTRCRRDSIFTAGDRTNMGTAAIAAGLTGLGAVASGLGAMAMDTTEEADLLELELDGKPVKAWVWVSVFNEGDEVEVAAERIGEIWYGYGIRRIRGNAMLLRGRIQNLRKKRCRRDFVFTANDGTNMGVTAIAAGLAGLGGVAAGLGGMAMDTAEEADLLEFELDGKSIKAWVWISMFKEGDEVEVVAEPDGNGWLGYGIRRISDRIVALHPHCSRGRYAHYKASFSWFFKLFGALLLGFWILVAIVGYFKSVSMADVVPILLAITVASFLGALTYGIIAYRIAMRFMGFVRLAEGIFQVFGWADVKNIDLPAITKKSKKPGDPGALGILFFRY